MAKIRLHPLNYLLIPLISITGIFCSHLISQYLTILSISIAILILINQNMNYKIMLWFVISLVPSLVGYFLASNYFNNHSQQENLTLIIRIICLSTISFVYIANLNFESLLIELMQRRLISCHIGFALLATNNALIALKQEFYKIQLSYQMRYQKKCYSPKVIIPLLVAASRYAHNISISLYSRGINQERTFYREKLHFDNWNIALLFFLTIIIIVITNFFH